ncbi:MAG: energy-coupling factor transporter transmembrane protein EcfT [Candidatus Adiutrix sp.]|jgi:energy-coupling factor transport system permease protein|nr:energy-coupling factor transporter transmembrane protein EcfT [Candidatus Adiutrix sp.]
MPDLSRIRPAGADRLGLAPEVRLGLTLLASLAALAADDLWAAATLLAASGLYLILQARLRTIALAYLFFGAMAMTALGCLWLLSFVFPALKEASPAAVIVPFSRLGVSVNMVLPLALHASLSGLVGTMNRLPIPGLVKLPMLVTIRFIPTFINDFSQLRQAVRLRFRGRAGLLFWCRRPFLWWRIFFMPLVVRLIRSADELAVAAELKGLSAETDFGRAPIILKKADRATLALGAAAVTAASILQVFHAAG